MRSGDGGETTAAAAAAATVAGAGAAVASSEILFRRGSRDRLLSDLRGVWTGAAVLFHALGILQGQFFFHGLNLFYLLNWGGNRMLKRDSR